MHRQKRLFMKHFSFVILLALSALTPAQMRQEREPKDMADVQRVSLAPVVTDDEENGTFRAALKQELVHNNFIVQENPEGTDATLNVEIASSHEGKGAKLEFHAMLDG